MQAFLAVNTRNWFTGGAHFLILAFAAQADSAAVWPYALAAMSAVSFAAWIASYRRLRRIADTPLSNIATAAQGYVEISGRSEAGATPLLSQLTHMPCLWYQYEVYEKSSDNKWALRDTGTSDAPFAVRDATGTCVIDPRGAEVVTSREQTWTEGGYRYTERLLLAPERIYGLGEFVTIGGASSLLDTNADVGAMLAQWKRDPAKLLSRFDLDKNGSLDLKEWELARRQARREVESAHNDARARDATNVLRKPADDRLFVLSNYIPERLRRRYAMWAWIHAIVCVAASGLAIALLERLNGSA
jgi:hypothetical protein